MTPDEKPKLHIDSDWKAQAQAEKEKLVKQEAGKEKAAAGRARELPEADFKTLMGVLASQAIMGLGAMGDPKTGRVVVDLEGSRFAIDLLAVLEEKTKGNLSAEEATELRQVLIELRNRFVQISNLVAQQAMEAPAIAAGAGASPVASAGRIEPA